MNAWAAKKVDRQKRIRAAATQLFDKLGYARTNMDQIAAAAGCGVATVYNYYDSKEGIATELLQMDMEAMLSAGNAVIHASDLPSDPGEAMMILLSVYRSFGGSDWARRDLLRITIFPNLGNDGALANFITVSEARAQEQIHTLLRKLREKGNLSSAIDIRDAATIVFAVFNQAFGRYLTSDDVAFEDMFAQLSRHICLLFDNWRASASNKEGTYNG